MLFRLYSKPDGEAYIAGAGAGIVTALGLPSSRGIYLFEAQTLSLKQVVRSLDNGHYIFTGLDPTKQYLVMVRDYKRELEPFAWDYVKPSDDLTFIEQKALWQTWQ